MIEHILIQNFQAHDKLRVDFDPAITTIVGPSDVGKSAIIRALRWVCTNQPGGDAFVRHGCKGATVKLVVDGHTIARRRKPGGDVNEYHLDDQAYRAFGRKVPEPIEALLNLGPVTWQGQHDAPYWFASTAGEVSRQLNAIVNLGIIDTALAAVAKALHRARTKLEAAEEDLTEANTTYADMAWVPAFEQALLGVEIHEAAFHLTADKANDVAALVLSAQRHRKDHAHATGVASAGDTVVTAGTAALQARERATALHDLIVSSHETRRAAATPVPDVQPMAAALRGYKTATKQGVLLRALLSDIHDKEAAAEEYDGAWQAAEKEVPNQCPTCGEFLSATSTCKREHP